MLGCERLELADDLGVPAGFELRLDAILDGGQPQLFEPADLRLCERFEGEISKRRAAPEGQTLLELRGARLRRLAPRLVDQPPESVEVELVALDAKLIAGRLRQERLRPQQLPQLRDEVL